MATPSKRPPASSTPDAARATAGQRAKPLERLKLFASHSHEYEDLARDFKRCVQAIPCCASIDVSIYQAMPGGTKWREWVHHELDSTDIFVLLYPHAGMQFKWCSYELGAFLGKADRPYVCIRNTNIKAPLDITDEWQDCLAHEEGLRQFLLSLLVEGVYTDGRPICTHAGVEGSDASRRLQAAAADLAGSFERARIRRDYYTQRICIESDGKPGDSFDLETDLDKAVVTGEEWALRLLSLQPNSKWSVLRKELAERRPLPQWPLELIRAFAKIKRGPIPPPFTPFRAGDKASDKVYLPVITRAESIDERLRKVYLIFVEADPAQMRSFFDIWVPAHDVANLWTVLIRALLMTLHARWLHVVPMLNRARRLDDEDEARALLDDARRTIAELERESSERHVNLLDAYGDILDAAQLREGGDIERELQRIRQEMNAAARPLTESVPALIERWITQNTRQARFIAALVAIKARKLHGSPDHDLRD
jgi:hypothetical protein